jgi:hypothetical protein
MTQLLDDVLDRLTALPEAERQSVIGEAMEQTKHMRFVPLPGPQTDAYLSEADVLLYGGQAGGGKSYLVTGLAQNHRSSIIFRRDSTQTDGLVKAGKAIFADSARFNGTDKEWSRADGWSLKLAGMQLADDWMKHAGRERDLIEFDEAGEFLRQQVSSMLAWLRGPAGQKCRMVLASNPPRSADGYWLKEWFAPWLDLHHPLPATPGELRWAVMVDGSPTWVDGPDDVLIEGEMVKPLSFTFIPAALADNPFRDTAEYRAKLQSLEEPLRSQLLRGDFEAGMVDGADQAIPTEWVKLAMERWKPQIPAGIPMCAIGVDVASGGADQTVLAVRHDGWFAPLEAVPGVKTPAGSDVAGLVLSKRRDQAQVIIDLGGGWGGDALRHLVENIGSESVTPYMGVKVSTWRTKDNLIRLKNVRTAAYWRFREALDPYQPGGSPIALPPDRELLADLTAATYKTISERGGMAHALEAKDVLTARLGRSPDKGDAVVMSWFSGAKAVTDAKEWQKRDIGTPGGRAPRVVMGHQSQRRRR